MEAFQQPICPATSTVAPPVLDTMHDSAHVVLNNEHSESQTRQTPNYAILYLVVAGVVFLAFPVFILQKDLRNRYRERNKKRAVIMRIKSKQAESATVAKEPTASSSTLPEQKLTPRVIVVEHKDRLELASSMEEDHSSKKQKGGERRKVGKGRPGNPRSSSGRSTSRGKPPSSTTHNSASSTHSFISRDALDAPIRIEVTAEAQEADLPQLPTPALSVAPELHQVSSMESLLRNDIDEPRTTPEAPVQNGSPMTDNDGTPTASQDRSFSPSSPMSKPVIISSLSTPPASPSLSEYPSRAPRKSSSATSATAPSTTAPLTPASIPASIPLPGPAVEDDEATWDRADSSAGDAAWDWDGQANNYSPSKTRKASEPTTLPPSLPSLPCLPSLVFPSLNDEPVPGASPASQMKTLKAALETSRENERNLRREVQHYSKECYTMKWRWSTAINEWQQREAQLQAQISHLMMQVQALSMQVPQYPAPPYALYPLPGSPFAQPYPGYPHAHQLSPLHSSPAPPSNDLSDVSEILAEAILKRPDSLRSSVSRGRRHYDSPRSSSGTRPLGPAAAAGASVSSSSSSASSHKGSPAVAPGEIQDIEFPTLLEKPMVSPAVLEPLNEGEEVASASS